MGPSSSNLGEGPYRREWVHRGGVVVHLTPRRQKASETRPLPPSGTVLTRLAAGARPGYVDASARALVCASLRVVAMSNFFCRGRAVRHAGEKVIELLV